MSLINELDMSFKAISVNEGFARSAVAAFCTPASPTLDEITDIKTAVSEAVTNVVVHAYPKGDGWVNLNVKLFEDTVEITIADKGIGIKDFKKAREPFYTSKPDMERSGMGFTVMESFMDSVELFANESAGLKVVMKKKFNKCKTKIVG